MASKSMILDELAKEREEAERLGYFCVHLDGEAYEQRSSERAIAIDMQEFLQDQLIIDRAYFHEEINLKTFEYEASSNAGFRTAFLIIFKTLDMWMYFKERDDLEVNLGVKFSAFLEAKLRRKQASTSRRY